MQTHSTFHNKGPYLIQTLVTMLTLECDISMIEKFLIVA